MPLTKVTSSLINTISASQITATGATAGQVLTYDGSTSTWVASAALTGGAGASSLTLSGYTTLGSGIILQWGRHVGSLDDTNTKIILPIAFPNAFLNASSTPYKAANVTIANTISTHVSITTSLSSFDLYGHGSDVATGYYWQAIGY